MDRLDAFSKRGYVVKETAPVYYTADMDKTAKWFEDVLGWYYEIDERNADNKGVYGCVYDLPREIENLHIAPFTGMHMFNGEPIGGVVAFIKVQGIEALHKYVAEKGWNDISEIKQQHWGGKLCKIKTLDGYTLQFFE
jgi:AraC family transcriptional regulator